MDSPGTAPAADGTRVLIIENDTRIVELLVWFLQRRGWCPRSAASFAEARPILAQGWAQLCLSDVDLGAEDGRRELPLLQAAGILPTTLVVSGYLDRESVALFESLPAVAATVSKPYDFEELEARMLEALERAGAVRAGGLGAGELSASGAAPPPPTPGCEPGSEPAVDRVDMVDLVESGDEDDEGWIEIGPAGAQR